MGFFFEDRELLNEKNVGHLNSASQLFSKVCFLTVY